MPDILLSLGLIFGLYSLIQFIAALFEQRLAYFWLGFSLIFGGMFAYGWVQQPSGFGFGQIPDAMIRALGQIIG